MATLVLVVKLERKGNKHILRISKILISNHITVCKCIKLYIIYLLKTII